MPVLLLDFPCVYCGYNVRGLDTRGLCPECGHELVETIRAARAGDLPEHFETYLENHEAWLQQAAEASGYPVDAVGFVFDAIAMTPKPGNGDGPRHLDARRVCEGVREYARYYFNDAAEGKELLSEWRVRSSEDVGAIVWGLLRVGLMSKSPSDSPDHFRGLFTLEELFEA